MRSRSEVELDLLSTGPSYRVDFLMLEVLLDIRELLQPVSESAVANLEVLAQVKAKLANESLSQTR